MPDGERKLATIMFTDIIGYTALTQDNESATVRLLDEHRKLIRPIFAGHGGREINGLLKIQFDWTLDGVRNDPRYLDLVKRLGLD